jgi:hypothetical protein
MKLPTRRNGTVMHASTIISSCTFGARFAQRLRKGKPDIFALDSNFFVPMRFGSLNSTTATRRQSEKARRVQENQENQQARFPFVRILY